MIFLDFFIIRLLLLFIVPDVYLVFLMLLIVYYLFLFVFLDLS